MIKRPFFFELVTSHMLDLSVSDRITRIYKVIPCIVTPWCAIAPWNIAQEAFTDIIKKINTVCGYLFYNLIGIILIFKGHFIV